MKPACGRSKIAKSKWFFINEGKKIEVYKMRVSEMTTITTGKVWKL